MARYFFHLRDGIDCSLDPEGRELDDLDAAKRVALLSARETLSHDMKDGRINLHYRIDVEDGVGTILHTVAFRDAFEIVP